MLLGKEKENVCQLWLDSVMSACTHTRIHALDAHTGAQVFFFLLPFAARCPITCLECYFHFAVRASLRESGGSFEGATHFATVRYESACVSDRIILFTAEIVEFQISRRPLRRVIFMLA